MTVFGRNILKHLAWLVFLINTAKCLVVLVQANRTKLTETKAEMLTGLRTDLGELGFHLIARLNEVSQIL